MLLPYQKSERCFKSQIFLCLDRDMTIFRDFQGPRPRQSKACLETETSSSEDNNENVRNVGVAEVLALRKQVTEESANNDDSPHLPNSSSIRLFDVPTLNLEANAKAYYELGCELDRSLFEFNLL